MTKITRLPATTNCQDICACLEADAALIIEDVMSPEQVERVKSEVSPFLAITPTGTGDVHGYNTKRVGALIARSPECRALAMNSLINAACSDYLAPHGDGYQLHFTQAVSIGPNEPAQFFHRDRGVWGGKIPRRIETQFSTNWAISNFTQENGATQVVPGSHKWAADRKPEADEIVSAEMKPGSVLIYSGTVLHGGGANQTKDQHRLGILLHYTLKWLRQEENQYLSCPPEIAKELSPALRALIGYSLAGPLLGFYSSPVDTGEPVEIADPDRLFR